MKQFKFKNLLTISIASFLCFFSTVVYADRPKIGFGTWQMSNYEAQESVKKAIESGIRHIDTAQMYGNEEGVGKAISECISKNIVKREDLFITSKLHPGIISECSLIGLKSQIRESVDESISKLQCGYIDEFLIHQSSCNKEKNQLIYEILMQLKAEHKIHSVGVSNFFTNEIEELSPPPTVVQNPFFVGINQTYLSGVLESLQPIMIYEAYKPLGHGNRSLLENSIINRIANRHQTTPAVICILYCMQKGTIPIFKSTNMAHINEIIQGALQIKLASSDLKELDMCEVENVYQILSN